MLIRKSAVAATVALTLAVAGCTTPDSANVYSKSELRRPAKVRSGVIEQIRPVKMEDAMGIGAVTGAAIGGIAAGSNIGDGRGSLVAGIVGALLGGLLGDKIERGIVRKDVLEITVRMENGERLVIVEDADINLQPGQTVDVIDDGKTARVVPAARMSPAGQP
ncbi:outer membrane lipoprotein SlyB [Formivibrio citricus]|uniref:Outer membrane lipoprotein SlyB n=1 Tax=Formivibrio citricus TaxID=83765 RepID=A0A1I5CF65_9NEIS|nr:glycine zipper 2TM domain-containing protein [Formivibrio citricus]SFN85563.1 outer membrane lipoprotein SlyB [Formivibrio citricus]